MDVGIDADRRRLKSRKLMLFRFSCHIPAWVLSEAFKKLPDDAMIVKCHHEDIETFSSSIVIWSQQFYVVHESKMLPVLEIEARDTGEVELKTFDTRIKRYRSCSFK